MPRKKPERKRPKRRPLRPKQRIRRKKPKLGSRRHRRQTPKKKITAVMVSPGTGDPEEQSPAKGARVRLNPGERELLAAMLVSTLPKNLQKALGSKGGSLWDVDYDLRRKYQIQLSLISRLRTPRRGHPSTW